MAKRKKLEKAAKKAYKRAEAAVDDAVKAAAKLDKDAKKRAKALRDRLTAAAPSAKRPKSSSDDKRADKKREKSMDAPAAAHIELTPPLPHVTDDSVDDAAEFAGSAATSAPHDPALDHLTVQALRDVARSRGLRNVSRLTKGQLIERLSD